MTNDNVSRAVSNKLLSQNTLTVSPNAELRHQRHIHSTHVTLTHVTSRIYLFVGNMFSIFVSNCRFPFHISFHFFTVLCSVSLRRSHCPSVTFLRRQFWLVRNVDAAQYDDQVDTHSHSNVRFLLIYLFFLFRFDSIPLFVFASCVCVCAIHEPSVYTVYRMLGETVWVFVRIRIHDWTTNDDVELAKLRIQQLTTCPRPTSVRSSAQHVQIFSRSYFYHTEHVCLLLFSTIHKIHRRTKKEKCAILCEQQ